jgi:ferredoxin
MPLPDFGLDHTVCLLNSEPSHLIVLETPEGEKSFRTGSDETIWDAAYAAGITLPAVCHQGSCLTCAGRLIGEGKFDHSRARANYPEDIAAGFVLVCCSIPLTDLRIRTHQQAEMIRFRAEHGLPAPEA